MKNSMRRITCDQFEFDFPDSEEYLELAIATPSRHCPDLATLLNACGASQLNGQPLPPNWPGWPKVTAHLARFACVEAPIINQIRTSMLLQDEWHEVELAVAFGTVLLWYHWSTSA